MPIREFIGLTVALLQLIDEKQVLGFSYCSFSMPTFHVTKKAHEDLRRTLKLELTLRPIEDDVRGSSIWNGIEIVFISITKPLAMSDDITVALPEMPKGPRVEAKK